MKSLTREPITGDEDVGDRSHPSQVLAEFYKAFNTRDLALMAENWDPSDEAVMDNPVGGITRGWADIRRVYERIFRSPTRVHVEFYDYTLHVVESVFYAVGRERGRFTAPGGALDLVIRTTRIFRRADGRWRQVHHHGSIDDPTLLETYQRAVRT
jgi:ketosteroid isomerase-like protein